MTILILGGTREAHEIADRIDRPAVVSLAHRLESRAYGVSVRHGGFGGRQAQMAWMVATGVRAIIDASHPFAEVISARTAAICAELALPYLRVLRSPWEPEPDWSCVRTAAKVVALVPENAVTLLALGSVRLAQFAGLRGYVICRSLMSLPDFPFARGEWLVATPGDLGSELDMMRRRGVTHLVARNSGGAGRAKLAAARALGVNVILIDRPSPPKDVTVVETAEEALAWLATLA